VTDAEARAALEALIRERREDYAGLSRLIGRNPSYIQQYVKRGSPRRLDERDRARLARYFGVPETTLGGEPARAMRIASAQQAGGRRDADLIAVPRLRLSASAGPGAFGGEEHGFTEMLFTPALLRELGAGRPAALSLIRVEGESMQPTLADGDDILVDSDDGSERLRDGIYVLRIGEVRLVKRVALHPGGGLSILSDNPRSPDWSDVEREALTIVGRVIWAGRRLR
jgi:phage repressor protein C with HTH and peptisase S24 domain